MSGTRNDVSIELVGSTSRTGSITKQNVKFFKSTIANRKGYDDIVFECKAELGEVYVIVLGNIERRPPAEDRLDILDLSDQRSGWLVEQVEYAKLQTEEPPVTFPCYNWIGSGDSISFTANTSKHSVHGIYT